MNQIDDLAKKIQIQEDIEAIKNVKYSYWRGADLRLWDLFADQWTEDCVVEIPIMGEKRVGRSDVIDFAKGQYDKGNITAFHMGHNPQIEITSDTTAKGIWMLQVYTENRDNNTRMISHGWYEDEYLKGPDGKWRHSQVLLTISTAQITPLEP
jgi:hypothetical protein